MSRLLVFLMAVLQQCTEDTGKPVQVSDCEPHPDLSTLCAAGVAAFDGSGTTYATIQDALDASVADDTVFVCPGTHTEGLVASVGPVLLRSASGDPSDTILDGEGVRQPLQATQDLTVQGLTFLDGFAGYDGGAIATSASLTVQCSVFDGNFADYEGGAIAFGTREPNTLTISGSTFTGNEAGYEGGALDIGSWAEGDVVTIEDSVFVNNLADYEGGAVNLGTWGSASLSITDSELRANDSRTGAAIHLGGWSNDYQVTLDAVIISGNTADQTPALSVGSRVSNADIFLIDGAILENISTGGSAAVSLSSIATLDCDGTDWGTAAGGDDNDPSDLSGPCSITDLGDDEVFTCP